MIHRKSNVPEQSELANLFTTILHPSTGRGEGYEALNSTIRGDAKYCVSTKGCSLEENGAKGFRTELTGPNKRLLQDNRSTG